MNTLSSTCKSELFDGDIGPVKYAFSVPGLSFADYCQGSRISLSPLYKKRSKYWFFLIVLIGLAVILGVLQLIKTVFDHFDIHLYMTLFQDNDDAGFRYSWWNLGVIVLFFYVFLSGYLAMFLLLFRRGRGFQQRVYRNNRSTQLGYYLELGENGLRSRTENGVSCFKWSSVTGFNQRNGMTFISLFAVSFFWLPDDFDGYDRDAVAAFITAKLTKPV